MKRTQIYLDEDQNERLGRRARATGVTKSALIRAAIDAFLKRGISPSEKGRALDETFGALPDIRVPDRSEWDRGHG
jgi:predicted transcriptional regulator